MRLGYHHTGIKTFLSPVRRLRSEEHAKQLMKTVCGVKIRKLGKYEKEWRRKMEEERQAVDPATRFERENKKLIADNMRSGK